jgi:hypothetical protein
MILPERPSNCGFSAALGYVIPQTGKIVILIIHQCIHIPHLEHNWLGNMQMRLNDVIVNETPKSQCLEPTNLSHTISVRDDNVDDVLVIPLNLHGFMYCFETFKPTQEEFDTYDRYELTHEIPQYDPSINLFRNQEAGMADYWDNLKLPGYYHPKRRKVRTLHQEELEIEKLSVAFIYTSGKLQDI